MLLLRNGKCEISISLHFILYNNVQNYLGTFYEKELMYANLLVGNKHYLDKLVRWATFLAGCFNEEAIS